MPHLSVAQARVDMTRSFRIGQQTIGRMIDWRRQSTRQLLPALIRPAEDGGLSVVLAVGFHRSRRDRDVPYVGFGSIGGTCPTVVPVEAGPLLRPGPAGIATDGCAGARTAGLVHPLTIGPVRDERVAISQGTLEVARPTTPAIRASYSCAGLDPNIDDVRVGRRECDGLHVGCVRFLGGREPESARANAAKRDKLCPVRTAVVGDEEERGLRAGVDGTGFCTAHREGLDEVSIQACRTPGPSAVIRAQYAASLRPGVSRLWVQRV